MGPGFKFAWTGSPGGKSGVTTIETNHEWDVARSAVMKKNKTTCGVTVKIDIDSMEGFHIRKRAHQLVDTNNDEELLYGTKVPRFNTFSDEAQLHALYILLLKNKWACQKHQGEHSQDSHCYIRPSSEHLRLNNFKLKKWAASIAAGDATKHEPPSMADFDGVRDGWLSDTKLRGRTGPCSATTSTSTTSDATTLLMAAMLPLITGHLGKLTANTFPPLTESTAQPLALSTPSRTCKTIAPPSPAPNVDMELHACIGDFLRSKGIDLLASEAALAELKL